MADDFGSKQTRVLEPRDKSYDTVVRYDRRPILSSEVNLSDQVGSFGPGRRANHS